MAGTGHEYGGMVLGILINFRLKLLSNTELPGVRVRGGMREWEEVKGLDEAQWKERLGGHVEEALKEVAILNSREKGD